MDNWSSWEISNIEFITVHGSNEGHIMQYKDIEFQLGKFQTYMQSIWEENVCELKVNTVSADGHYIAVRW